MSPEIGVVSLTDSFSELWDQLASSVGGGLRVSRSSADLERSDDFCCIVVSAAGAEDVAIGVIEELHRRRSTPLAVAGAETDYRLAITYIQAGASGYFALPGDVGMLRSWIGERVEAVIGNNSGQAHAFAQRTRYDFSKLLGRSVTLVRTLNRASKIIPRPGATVLITGETGTGKELLARAIHYNGPRSGRPFVEINCAALPENLLEAELFGYEAGAFTDAKVGKPGLIETADGGTLFLDEIGDLSIKLQGKLLRVIEERRIRRLGSIRDHTVDIRVVAATHVNLLQAVHDGVFREDLYYRLNVVPLTLPALRDRGEDILVLAKHFLQRFCAENEIPALELSREACRVLLAHAWPGNIRELRNAIERAVLLCERTIDPEHFFIGTLSEPTHPVILPFPASMSRIERAAAKAMMDFCNGNKSEAARALGISRKHLYALLVLPREGDEPRS